MTTVIKSKFYEFLTRLERLYNFYNKKRGYYLVICFIQCYVFKFTVYIALDPLLVNLSQTFLDPVMRMKNLRVLVLLTWKHQQSLRKKPVSEDLVIPYFKCLGRIG